MKQTDSKGLFVQLYEYIWVYYICIWSELFVNELQALRDFSDCPSLMQTQHDTVSARSQMACNYSHHPCILYSLIYVYMKYVNISIYIWYIYILMYSRAELAHEIWCLQVISGDGQLVYVGPMVYG